MKRLPPLHPLDPGDSVVGVLGELSNIPTDSLYRTFTESDLADWKVFAGIRDPAFRQIHSLLQFGLIAKSGTARYRLTAVGRRLRAGASEMAGLKLIRRVAMSPPAFRTLYDRFGGQPVSEEALLRYLRDLEAPEEVVKRIANCYWRTALYADSPKDFIARISRITYGGSTTGLEEPA